MSDTWKAGVQDSIKMLENRRATTIAVGGISMVHPAYLVALDELLIFLKSMLERGEYRSVSVLDGQGTGQGAGADLKSDGSG